MLTTIHFHKSLQKYTGVEKHSLDVTSYLDLIQSCVNLFPKLQKIFKKLSNNNFKSEELAIVIDNKLLTKDELYFKPHYKNKITLCPVIYGAGGKAMLIVAIIAFVVLAVVTYGASLAATPLIAGATSATAAVAVGTAAAASAATLSSIALLSATIAMTLVGMLLTPTVKPAGQVSSDSAQRTNNELFDGLTNTIGQGAPVQLNYGLIRIAGHFISGYVDTVEHGKADIINVKDAYFN